MSNSGLQASKEAITSQLRESLFVNAVGNAYVIDFKESLYTLDSPLLLNDPTQNYHGGDGLSGSFFSETLYKGDYEYSRIKTTEDTLPCVRIYIVGAYNLLYGLSVQQFIYDPISNSLTTSSSGMTSIGRRLANAYNPLVFALDQNTHSIRVGISGKIDAIIVVFTKEIVQVTNPPDTTHKQNSNNTNENINNNDLNTFAVNLGVSLGDSNFSMFYTRISKCLSLEGELAYIDWCNKAGISYDARVNILQQIERHCTCSEIDAKIEYMLSFDVTQDSISYTDTRNNKITLKKINPNSLYTYSYLFGDVMYNWGCKVDVLTY